jgi:predicted ABC-type ATPase
MEQKPPHDIVLAGPNGAGKTTASRSMLAGTLGVLEFVNADVIAQGLSGFQPERAALQAGRLMLSRLHELADQRADFAFETTLASKTFAPWLPELRQNGYQFFLAFFWLPSPEMAIARVADRVCQGGHDVPSETIRRRYRGGLRNFFALYQPLADVWRFYDNSDRAGPRLIASGGHDIPEAIADATAWQQVLESVKHE